MVTRLEALVRTDIGGAKGTTIFDIFATLNAFQYIVLAGFRRNHDDFCVVFF